MRGHASGAPLAPGKSLSDISEAPMRRPDKIRGNVFVANLPRGVTDEQLAEAFDAYGLVLRAHLARDPATGESRGFGLVQIAPDRAVEAAVAGVDGTELGGRHVQARRADPAMGIAVTAPARAAGGGGAWLDRDHRASRPSRQQAYAGASTRGGEYVFGRGRARITDASPGVGRSHPDAT